MTATAGSETRKKAAERAEEIIEKKKEHYFERLLEDDTLPANPRQIIRLNKPFHFKDSRAIDYREFRRSRRRKCVEICAVFD